MQNLTEVYKAYELVKSNLELLTSEMQKELVQDLCIYINNDYHLDLDDSELAVLTREELEMLREKRDN